MEEKFHCHHLVFLLRQVELWLLSPLLEMRELCDVLRHVCGENALYHHLAHPQEIFSLHFSRPVTALVTEHQLECSCDVMIF